MDIPIFPFIMIALCALMMIFMCGGMGPSHRNPRSHEQDR